MSLKQVKDVVESSETGKVEMKESPQPNDSGSSLQRFLNRIPISSIPGIKNSPVLALKTGDSVRDAINLLYEKNVCGGPIVESASGGFSEPFIGFIEFATMVLWCLQESCSRDTRNEEVGCSDFFAILEQYPHIGQTKIGELAKLYLWDSYFPVNFDETLFHVLLLFSKHRMQVVPVIERMKSQLTGFITQHGVIHLLLQSSGLDWFDSIADKLVSDVRIGNEDHVVHVYGNQSIAEALDVLWKNRTALVAVVERESTRLIGSITNSDIYLVVENDNIFRSIN